MTTARQHVGIVGLGLMGGSLARDLLRRGIEVTAYDTGFADIVDGRDGESEVARIRRAPDLATVADAPIVVIAVPVQTAVDVLSRLAPHLGPAHLVMDVGSTKRHIVASAEALGLGGRFVGCHPLAGDHRSGWAASRAGLFDGVPVFLCPPTGVGSDALPQAAAFWAALGACPEVIDADTHDRRMAWVSHLPHMLSAALSLALGEAGLTVDALGPGGRGMTRLAASSPDLWTQIAGQNRPFLIGTLDAFEDHLRHLRRAIEAGDHADLARYLAAAAVWTGARPAPGARQVDRM